MQVAIASGGIIQNIIEAASVPAAQELFPHLEVFGAAGVGIGWIFNGSEWHPPALPEAPSGFPTLTRKQLRNGLLSIGVTSADVEAHITAIADPLDREAAMIDWQDTQTYERTYPLVDEIAAAMSLPPEQVDALWMWSAGQ
ncbi:hypothetical protein [Rhizobium sp. SSA_523]|uniref:hypothetical protein n=1 Tax=Rhizobium sp. SSA_523 TaxID=2952477 RepID=UPI002090C9C8|nr:hypothetical protein [Rhizobium sp. SSA_523]MCO5734134.1 hypothetical protein [Rhizobium sp. SSA_523]WKC24771.1 hypothetical protein QTJ18_12145 [Rhizobium sp. SSA_523]